MYWGDDAAHTDSCNAYNSSLADIVQKSVSTAFYDQNVPLCQKPSAGSLVRGA